MLTVYKYAVKPGKNEIELPEGAELLCIAPQGQGVFLWARVDTAAPRAVRVIYFHGTGHAIEAKNPVYIGTAFNVDGWMVWHAFEEVGT